jgi:hypothetical protein
LPASSRACRRCVMGFMVSLARHALDTILPAAAGARGVGGRAL